MYANSLLANVKQILNNVGSSNLKGWYFLTTMIISKQQPPSIRQVEYPRTSTKESCLARAKTGPPPKLIQQYEGLRIQATAIYTEVLPLKNIFL